MEEKDFQTEVSKTINSETIKYAKMQSKLSVQRTLMSAERTFLSYISASVVFVSLAVTFLKLFEKLDTYTIIFFCLSGAFFLFGVLDFFITVRAIKVFNDDLDE